MTTGLERHTDQQVEAELREAVRTEAKSTVRVLRCLIEFERRRLHSRKAYPSLFEYCTKALGYSEEAAYKRTRVAQAAADRGEILDLLARGRTNLTKLVVVVAHLKTGPVPELLEKACTMTKRELEFYVAGLAPKAITKDSVRMLGETTASLPLHAEAAAVARATEGAAPTTAAGACGVTEPQPPSPLAPIARVEALTPELARIAVTVDRVTVEKYDRACALLHVRRADGGRVFSRALDALLRDIDPDLRLEGAASRRSRPPDPSARRVSCRVQAFVRRRDGGRCTFRDADGNRCSARVGLQFDHIIPWALGGRSDDPENIRLLCELHNRAEARRWYGDDYVDRAIALDRKKRDRGREAPA